MKRLLHKVLLAIVSTTLSIVLPAAAQKADVSLLNYNGPDRMDRIRSAAKKEGEVMLYTSIPAKEMEQVTKPFEDKYGIKVSVWRGGPDKVLQRMLSEAKAKKYEADLVQIRIPDMEAMAREKIFQPVNSPTFKDLIPDAVPKHREWVVSQIPLTVLGYNTNLVKKEDLPKSYQDLLDPKWKGKLGIEATNYDWFATVVEHNGGVKLFRNIVAKNGISVRKGHTLLGNLVIAGEVPLALTLLNYMPEQAKRKGAPIDWFTLEPTLALATSIGITRRAPHPNAALLFYEFMLTEGQRIMASMDNVPSNSKVESNLKNVKFKFIDPDTSLDKREERERIFLDVMAGK
jgi:iron(III) transport system substrate-binding protein